MTTGQPARAQKPKNTQKARLSVRQRQLLIGSAVSALLIVLIVMVYQTTRTTDAKANVVGDYRSKGNGNWSSSGTWQTYNGTTWVNAGSAPNSSNNVISIRNGHTVTVSNNVTADQILVEAGGRLNIGSGNTLTVAAGSGADLENFGTIGNTGTITLSSGASIEHEPNSVYIHTRDGGTIPTATWASSSTCSITGVTGNMPAGINQNFGVFTWNCTGQSSNLTFNQNMNSQSHFNVNSTGNNYLRFNNGSSSLSLTIGGNLNVTNGDFRVTNNSGPATLNVSGDVNISNSSNAWFTATSGSGACTANISGDVNISNGVFWVNEDVNACTMNITGNLNLTNGEFIGSDWSGASTVNISGNMNISGNTSTSFFRFTRYTNTCTVNLTGNLSVTGGNLVLTQYAANGILKINGNYTHTGGVITENSTTNTGEISFTGTTVQTITASTNVTNTVNYTVASNAYAQMAGANDYINGGGSFTVQSGAKLGIRSSTGISSSGNDGHIRVTGNRNFNTGADYLYNASTTQNTGSGLPATVRRLTVNNTGLTLTNSVTASDSLVMTAGNITTNNNTLTIGTGTSTTGNLFRNSGRVIGRLKRWFAASTTSDVVFPIGTTTDYNGITITMTSAPTAGGTVLSTFTKGWPGNLGLPITDAGDVCQTIGSGWWTMTPADGLTGGTFTVKTVAEGFTGINDFTTLHLFRRDNEANVWEADGTHAAPIGTIASPTIIRNSVNEWGQFAITSTAANPLPVALTSLKVNATNGGAKVLWSTASEKNCDFFMVERSATGTSFQTLGRVAGAGNSTTPRSYNYFDATPLAGTSYYRLVQYDFDGSKEIFGPVAFNNAKKGGNAPMVASPNPFSNDLNLRFMSEKNGTWPMIIRNQSGQTVYNGTMEVTEGHNDISLLLARQLRAGTYTITIGEGDTQMTTKVIKQ
jgi:hypothetical protein